MEIWGGLLAELNQLVQPKGDIVGYFVVAALVIFIALLVIMIKTGIFIEKTDILSLLSYIALFVFISINLVALSGFIAGILFFPTGVNQVNDGLCIGNEPVRYVLYDKNSNKPIGKFCVLDASLYYLSTLIDSSTQISAPFEIQLFIFLIFLLGFYVTDLLIESRDKSPRKRALNIGRGIIGFFGLGGLFVVYKLLFVIGEFAGRVGVYFWLLLIFLWFFGGYAYVTRIWKFTEPVNHGNY